MKTNENKIPNWTNLAECNFVSLFGESGKNSRKNLNKFKKGN